MNATSRRAVIILSSIVVALTLGVVPAASAARGRVYTYRLDVLGVERLGNPVQVSCTGSNVVIPNTLLHPVSPSTFNMFPTRAYEETFNVTLNASTKLSVTGPLASRVRNACAMNEKPLSGTESGEANPTIFTWRLTQPAHNLAQIVTHPATEAVIQTEGE